MIIIIWVTELHQYSLYILTTDAHNLQLLSLYRHMHAPAVTTPILLRLHRDNPHYTLLRWQTNTLDTLIDQLTTARRFNIQPLITTPDNQSIATYIASMETTGSQH